MSNRKKMVSRTAFVTVRGLVVKESTSEIVTRMGDAASMSDTQLVSDVYMLLLVTSV